MYSGSCRLVRAVLQSGFIVFNARDTTGNKKEDTSMTRVGKM